MFRDAKDTPEMRNALVEPAREALGRMQQLMTAKPGDPRQPSLPYQGLHFGVNSNAGEHSDVFLEIKNENGKRTAKLSVYSWSSSTDYRTEKEKFDIAPEGFPQPVPLITLRDNLRNSLDLIPSDREYNHLADLFARAEAAELTPYQRQRIEAAVGSYQDVTSFESALEEIVQNKGR